MRNQVGVFDPLLVISASRAVPPDAGRAPGRPKYDAMDSLLVYRAWQNQLLADRRARVDNAGYLPIGIPEMLMDAERRRARQTLGAFNGYEARRRVARPPWWETRLVRIGVPRVVAGALLAGFVVKNQDSLDSHCGTSDAAVVAERRVRRGYRRVDYIDQPSDATIRQVSRRS